MEYEISIQAILIGVLKKWKQMLAIFLVVFGALIAKNIYSAVQQAEANNKKADEAAAGYVVDEQTVTTANKEVLTVAQLNQRIIRIKQSIDYYNNINMYSPQMKSDVNNVYNYCKTYLIRLANANEVDTDKYMETIISALKYYILSDDFKNAISSVSETVKPEFLPSVFVINSTGMSININIRYLDRDLSKKLMSEAEPLLIKKLEEVRTVTENFTYTLIDTSEYSFADSSLIEIKNSNDAALSKAKIDYEALKRLAMTVESEDQIGTTGSKVPEAVKKVGWLSKLSKKGIFVALICGVASAILIVGLWYIFFSKGIQSAYEVADYLKSPILDVEVLSKKSVINNLQYKKFKNTDISLMFAILKKKIENNGGKRIVLEEVGFDSDNSYVDNVKKEMKGIGIETMSVLDYYSRADFMGKCIDGDQCVFIINLNNAKRKDILSRMKDLDDMGVNVIGSFVMI